MMVRSILAVSCLVLAVFGMVALDAAAQFGRGPRLEPERAAAAWELQATSTAKAAGLSSGDASDLLEAYKAARAAHGKALRELFEEGERREGGWEAMRELTEEHRAALEDAVGEFIDEEEQLEKVMEPLGLFNRQWDGYVHAAIELKLDDEVQGAALKHIVACVTETQSILKEVIELEDFEGVWEDFAAIELELDDEVQGAALNHIVANVTETPSIFKKAIEFEDFEGVWEDFRDIRDEMNEALAKTLSDEQMAAWTKATERRRNQDDDDDE
jgi:hypothetical protein